MLRPPSVPEDRPGDGRASFGARLRAWALARSRTERRLAIALGLASAALVAMAAAFGPIVRSRVAAVADHRNLVVTVGAVRPGLFAITLHDVGVRARGLDGAVAQLSEVRIALGAPWRVRGVTVQGGAVELEGRPEELLDKLQRLRGSSDATGSGVRTTRMPIAVTGLSLTWKVGPDEEVRVLDLAASRSDDAVHAAFERLDATHARGSVHASRGDIELGADGALRAVHLASLVVEGRPPQLPKPHRTTPSPSAEPLPPNDLQQAPEAPSNGPTRKALLTNTTSGPTPPSEREQGADRVLPLPDVPALRKQLTAVAGAIGRRLPVGSKVQIEGLQVKLDLGGDEVTFGPGPLSVERTGDLLRVGFTSDRSTSVHEGAPNGEGTPLSVEAELPLTNGDIQARLSGGPVSLALLGVHEGTKGLFDVAHGTVEGKGTLTLPASDDALTFDGKVALRGISVDDRRLSPEPLRGIGLSVAARGAVEAGGHVRVDDATLEMGALHVHAHGTAEESASHLALAFALDVAPAACQALVDSAPRGLLPIVSQTRMDGTFGANVTMAFDTRALDKLSLDYAIDDRCRMTEVPRELSREQFQTTFTHRIYHPDGTQGEATTGPGSPDWTALGDISPFMMAAVLTTEDGAFYKHHGFNHGAIRSSIAANLKARKFVRGASTITMQLAKNLFLSRQKTLSRKIEEVILTDYLEQAFPKDDMMELYLNVVEFGPDVYGITQAADYYFGRKPAELDVTEAFFLAMLLPSPVRYGKLHDKGTVPDPWMHHLQALLRIAAKNGKITEAERDVGLTEAVVFWQAGDPRPPSRMPAGDQRRDPYESDAAWQPAY